MKNQLIEKITYNKKAAVKLPAFVDVHVHLREPGFAHKETIATGTLAAAANGYSTICAMPNLKPVPDNLEHLKAQLEIIEKDARIRVIPYGAITCSEAGKELADLEAMAPYVCGFSDDGVGLNDGKLMEEAMRRAKALNRMIVAHCEDMTLRAGGYIHAGEYARAHGHKGISSASEYQPIARDLELAAKTGCAYHVCHISTKESVDIIRKAKARGIDVTCETAPHYLVLSDSQLQEDAAYKMNPPIRSEEDRQALIAGLLDGTIDMIATDHAPHTTEEKSRGLEKSAMGITGLEVAFPILYTELVKPGILTLEKLVELMSINPQNRFSLHRSGADMGNEAYGGFNEGIENNYAIWDMETEYEINPEEFFSMGKVTPFRGRRVQGRCLKTVVDGKTVWEKE